MPRSPDQDDLRLPGPLADPFPPAEAVYERLDAWGHPRPRRWIRKKVEAGRVRRRGAPPRLDALDVWRELLRDECDKLYNQAWCALERIRAAGDESEVWMLAVDDLPSAVEQAYSLAPHFATEHLELLRSHRQERLDAFLAEMAAGTRRERAERIECLAFWEENAEGMSDLRRSLFRLVREGLEREREEEEEMDDDELARELADVWSRIREALLRGEVEQALPHLLLEAGSPVPSPAEAREFGASLPDLSACRFLTLARRPDKPRLVGYYAEEPSPEPYRTTVLVLSFVDDGAWKFAAGPMGMERVTVEASDRDRLLERIRSDPRLRL